MKRTLGLLLALVLFGATHPALAQTRSTPCDPATPNNALCFVWAPITSYKDGTAIPASVTVSYRLEQQAGSSWNPLTTTTELKLLVPNLAPGTYTFRGFAVTNGVLSDVSDAFGKTITSPQPAKPVFIIAATINANGPPTYRQVYTVTPQSEEFVFLSPVSAKVLASR